MFYRSKRVLLILAVLSLVIPTVIDAQQIGNGAPKSPLWTQAMELYAQCLQDLGARGDYTWTDGGASAVRLTDACRIYAKPVIDECMAMNFHPDEKTCRLTAVLYAQTALRSLHK